MVRYAYENRNGRIYDPKVNDELIEDVLGPARMERTNTKTTTLQEKLLDWLGPVWGGHSLY